MGHEDNPDDIRERMLRKMREFSDQSKSEEELTQEIRALAEKQDVFQLELEYDPETNAIFLQGNEKGLASLANIILKLAVRATEIVSIFPP